MIISHSRKFIFVAVPKTANSSTAVALSRLCGRGDIITGNSTLSKAQRKTLATLDGKVGDVYRHTPLATAFDIYGEKILDYKIIAGTRNPFDRTVDSYLYQNLTRVSLPREKREKAAELLQDPKTFRQMVLSTDGDSTRGLGLHSLNGVDVADFIVRQEHYADDLEKLSTFLDAGVELCPVHLKRMPWFPNALLDDAGIRELIELKFTSTFRRMGYGGPGTDCPEYVPHPDRQEVKRIYVENLMAKRPGFRRSVALSIYRGFWYLGRRLSGASKLPPQIPEADAPGASTSLDVGPQEGRF